MVPKLWLLSFDYNLMSSPSNWCIKVCLQVSGLVWKSSKTLCSSTVLEKLLPVMHCGYCRHHILKSSMMHSYTVGLMMVWNDDEMKMIKIDTAQPETYSCVYSTLSSSLIKIWYLHYPQCNLAAEWQDFDRSPDESGKWDLFFFFPVIQFSKF